MNSIPKGYKKTEVGVIPEDWEVKVLGDICEKIIGGGTPSRNNKIYWDGKIPWATVKDLSSFNANSTQEYITEEGLRESSSTLIPSGMIIIATRMLIGQPVIYNCDVAINQDLKALSLIKGYDKYYLSYCLKLLSKKLISASSGSTVLGISILDLKALYLTFPSLPEQKAIAEVLSDMDALIEAQKELIAKKRYIKHGTMEDLLSGRVRLSGYETKGWKHTDIGDIPNDWEVSQIGKIADIISGGTPKTTEKSFWNGTILWCTPTDITRTSGRYIENTEKTITDNGLKNSSAILIPINSLLLCSRATVGDVRIAKHEITTNQGFKSLVCNSSAYYLFIYYLIPFLKPKMLEKSYGSTFLEISKSNLASIQIQLPSYIEQKTIAETLSDMDDEIETLEAELKKLNHMKRGMMQELLTGRIRLI